MGGDALNPYVTCAARALRVFISAVKSVSDSIVASDSAKLRRKRERVNRRKRWKIAKRRTQIIR